MRHDILLDFGYCYIVGVQVLKAALQLNDVIF